MAVAFYVIWHFAVLGCLIEKYCLRVHKRLNQFRPRVVYFHCVFDVSREELCETVIHKFTFMDVPVSFMKKKRRFFSLNCL